MPQPPNPQIVKKVKKLSEIAEALRQGKHFPVTRLTTIKSLCGEPEAAAAFALFLAGRIESKMRQEQGPERYRELVDRAVKELKPYLTDPTEERKERLSSLYREMEAEQNEYKKIGWDMVRMLKSRDLVVVEASLKSVLMSYCQPTAHRIAFSDSASLRARQTRADSASHRFVPVMMSSHCGAPDSPLTPGGVESLVSYGRRPLRESLDIRALPPSRRSRPSRERQTGVTGRFPVRRAEPTFLADEMSAPADFQVSDAVSEERTSGRSDALSVRNSE